MENPKIAVANSLPFPAIALYRSQIGKSEKLPNTESCIFEMVSLVCLDKYKHLKYQLLETRMWGKDVGCRLP